MSTWALAAAVVLAVAMVAALPEWPWMRAANLGYFPSGAALGLLLVVAILVLAGTI